MIVSSVYFELLLVILIRPHHFELLHNVHCFADVQLQRLEALVNKDFAFLRHLVLCDWIQICKTFVQKRCNVLDLLQNLCVVWRFNKSDEFFKDMFYVLQFFLIWCNYFLFVNKSLFLSFVFSLEFKNYVLFLFI